MPGSEEIRNKLSSLPAMHLILEEIARQGDFDEIPYVLVKKAAKLVLEEIRHEIIQGQAQEVNTSREELIHKIQDRAKRLFRLNLRPVVNASGTIIHTNLGRSVLAEKALCSLKQVASGYSNLEYNLETGDRGSRYQHVIDLLKELTGAEDALVVNNNAAAVLLVLHTFARGKEVIVSRGEMVEIGGSFRIPDVMKASGAQLVEVGTTNKTYLADYRDAITEDTAILLKAHTSNYRVLGFTASVSLTELAGLAERENLLAYEDLGSGVILDMSRFGIDDEPTVASRVEAGIHLVSFSGDKLLGGPQAGIIVGEEDYVNRLKKNQLTRALRVDKFTIAALEATISLYLEPEVAVQEIPTLQMLSRSEGELKERAIRLKEGLERVLAGKVPVKVIKGVSKAGGGALPLHELPTYLVAVRPADVVSWEQQLRLGEPPVICRIQKGMLLFDCRTLLQGDEEKIIDRIDGLVI